MRTTPPPSDVPPRPALPVQPVPSNEQIAFASLMRGVHW